MSDYDSVVRILNQGQALHINWRPDIYKPNDALLPKAVFEEIVKGDTFYIAENEGNVIGILELIFRHIESPAQVTRDIVFIDTMAVDEPYRGMGVGHLFFEKVKEIKAKKRLDGIELQVNAKNQAAYEMYCN
jgi:N-acetylglutamate synthase-like GNAT family acetyltransferase